MSWNDNLQFDLDLNQDLLNTQLLTQNLLNKNQRRLNAGLMFKNNLGNLSGILSGIAGGPIGWIGLGVKALGDNIQAARSQFDLAGFNSQLDDARQSFMQATGNANTTSDLLNLQDQIPDFTDDINNQGYKWDGNILGGIGAIIGNARTERQKQQARAAQAGMLDQLSGSILNAQNRVSTNTYRQGMANFLNNAAMGGPLSTHGSDFSDGLIRIDAGGTHEQNLLGGVPAGVDPNGIPNLVEEGETIWEDYVFSDRLKTPKALVKKYALGGGKKGLTYSEAARKVSEKSGTTLRPNDPISKRTEKAILSELEESQEEKRIAKEQRDAIKAMSEMSPEEFEALFTAQPQPATMEAQVPPQGVEEEIPAEEPLMQEPVGFEPTGLQGFALGGHILDGKHKESRRTVSSLAGPQRLPGVGVIWDRDLGTLMPRDMTGTAYVVGNQIEEHKTSTGRTYYTVNGERYQTLAGAQDAVINAQRAAEANRAGRLNSAVVTGDVLNSTLNNANREAQRVADSTLSYEPLPNERYDVRGDGRFLPNDYASYWGRIHASSGNNKSRTPVITAELPEVQVFGTRNTGSSGKGSGSGIGSRRVSTSPTSILSALNADVAADTDALADAILSSTPIVRDTPINLGNDNFVINRMSIPRRTPEGRTLPTWMRYAPIIGGGLSVLSDVFSRPDYSGYESLLADSRRLSSPVNIPVQTIGNRIRRNPFDERLSVNQANQNLAAGLRSTANNAGGNRAYRQFANNLMAYNNQGQFSDIARNAYLANRQDAFQTAEFNRGTDMYNTSAINQRNLTQAQLNANRQSQGYYARANALNALENARRYDDQLASADLTAFLQSLGNLGRENFIFNQIDARRREGLSPVSYNGDKSGIWQFYGADGGKKKTKKRRF